MEYTLLKEYGIINERTDQLGNHWVKKLTLVSWGDRKPLYDLREWSADGSICRSGSRLNESELYRLGDLIKEVREDRSNDTEPNK